MARGVQIGGFTRGTRARFNKIKSRCVENTGTEVVNDQLLIKMMDSYEYTGDFDPALIKRITDISDPGFKADLITLIRSYEIRKTRV